MKHPALARAFAVVLAVLCLVMLIAGISGIGKALDDYEDDVRVHKRLTERIDRYIELSERMEGAVSYADSKEELDSRQDSHDEQSADHRTELATYSATKGGLATATQALDEGDAQIASAKEQLESGWQQYNAAVSAISGARGGLSALGLGGVSDPGAADPAGRKNAVVSAYGAAIGSIDGANGIVGGLISAGILPADQASALTGALAQLREGAAAGQTAASNMEDVYFADDTVFGGMRDGYNQLAGGVNGSIGGIDAALEAALQAMEPMKKTLEESQAQLEQAEEALYYNRTLIWYELGQAEEKAEELRREKEELDTESEALKQLKEDTKNQQQLEKDHTSTRLLLLDNEEIQAAVDAGGELVEASRAYAEKLESSNERNRIGRLAANIIMILGAVACFMGIPAAFEMTKSRMLLILPVLVCFVCSCTTETISLWLGRGMMYSALGGIIFAAVQLLVVLPREKRPMAEE